MTDKKIPEKADYHPHPVCPWWGGYFLDNWVRRVIHNPEKIVGPYLQEDMRVLDIGCGFGFFSLAMAEMVGNNGVVIATDLQQKMLDVMLRRAQKRGVEDRIKAHRCSERSLELSEQVDFALACWMVHETPDILVFFNDVYNQLKPGANFLVLEPKIHCSEQVLELEKTLAAEAGFSVHAGTNAALSSSILLTKPSQG